MVPATPDMDDPAGHTNHYIHGSPIDLMDDTNDFKTLATGDDGITILKKLVDGHQTVIKCFVDRGMKTHTDDSEIKFIKEIAKDQAMRELKAISLVGGHENFFSTATTPAKLEVITLRTRFDSVYENIPSIALNYVENLISIDNATAFFGFSEGVENGSHTLPLVEINYKNTMNFEHRNILFKYVSNQLFSATDYMHSRGITHRDLDSVNVQVVYPSIRVKIMDFAKAGIPDIDGYPHSENPDNIYKTAKQAIKELQAEIMKTQDVHARSILLRRKSLWEHCKKQYDNPFRNRTQMGYLIPDEKVYTDEMQIIYITNSFTHSHLHQFQWSISSENEEPVIRENALLCDFVSNYRQFSLKELIKITQVEASEVEKAIPSLNIDDAHSSKGWRSANEDFYRYPRHIVHSKAYTRIFEVNKKMPSI